MLIVVGTVIQDVVADAMSTEVVSARRRRRQARPEDEVRAELGMVQVLGRLALWDGILAVAGLSGWLAGFSAARRSSCLGLRFRRSRSSGVLLITVGDRRAAADRLAHPRRRARLWAVVLALALGGLPFGQEFIFVLSMTVICTMLVFVTRELDAKTKRAILSRPSSSSPSGRRLPWETDISGGR